MKSISVIILTYNEEQHISRCIESVRDLANEIFIVDSKSTDRTVDVAESLGARIFSNPWLNYATQFNWALDNLPISGDWVMRLDADEYLTPQLIAEIEAELHSIGFDIDGVYCSRRMTFLGKLIRYGGVFPVRVLRLFRIGRGRCENRWMDEHIKVSGRTADFSGELIDDNLNSLTWWTAKHNSYASREAVDMLNLEYNFIPHDTVANLRNGKQAGIKRWIKEVVYARLPGGFRSFVYFIYRYVIRLGFLDGRAGMAFHFLQGFWYRYLVDAKVAEVKRCIRETDLDVRSAIQKVLGIVV